MKIPDGVMAISGKGIAAKAAEVAALSAGKSYLYGGKTLEGFDCSGFVGYVFKQLFQNKAGLFDMNTDSFTTSNLFQDIKAQEYRPGDIVIFTATNNLPAHIGIVYSHDSWISSQTSTGVALVKFSNPWWGTRVKKFRRLKTISIPSVRSGQRRTRYWSIP